MRGERPSIDVIRIELANTGSSTTIHRYVRERDRIDAGSVEAPAGASPSDEGKIRAKKRPPSAGKAARGVSPKD